MAGVSEATMGRAMALANAEPDLLKKVTAGEITLNEALRRKRKAEVTKREEIADPHRVRDRNSGPAPLCITAACRIDMATAIHTCLPQLAP